MNALRTKIAMTVALGAVIATTALASAYPGEKLASQAAVTIARARTMATQVVPGTIVSEELEEETGGSGLRYTFDIRSVHGVREVCIDAKTGKLLENSADSAALAPATPESGEGAEGSGD